MGETEPQEGPPIPPAAEGANEAAPVSARAPGSEADAGAPTDEVSVQDVGSAPEPSSENAAPPAEPEPDVESEAEDTEAAPDVETEPEADAQREQLEPEAEDTEAAAPPEALAEPEASAEPSETIPAATPEEPEALADEALPPRPRVPWWPFLLYFGVWLTAVGVAAWYFVRAPAAASIAGEALYPYTLRAGLVLTALGPILALVVWFVVWISAGRGRRRGLLSSALLKGALFTTFGVVVWWVMLVAVDRFRFGRLW